MKFDELFRNTFKALRPHPSAIRHQVDLMLPSMPMVEACRADDFDFFHPFIDAGKITLDDMHRACARYFLGKTKSGKPIFWMIDDKRQPLDAHIGTARWLSSLLKVREPLLSSWRVQHCLFGLHLLNHGVCPNDSSAAKIRGTDPCDSAGFIEAEEQDLAIAIVESEASAVVLSELFPESIWLAYATTSHLTPDLFAPLEGRSVTIYPRTDPSMSTYLFFLDYADLIRKHYPSIDLTVDATLEDYASNSQKDRCIDLLEFLLDSL